MRLRILILAPLALFFASTVLAQDAAKSSQLSDDWHAAQKPAAASSVAYGDTPRTASDSESSHFKFKERSSYKEAPANAAQSQSGKAPVMGRGGMGQDGRPAVSCASTPRDPACR